MSFVFNVPDLLGNLIPVELKPGSSTFIVGANGSGKTRLATQAERQWGEKAHRISAHRSLDLNPDVAKISENKARAGLRFGYPDVTKGQETAYRDSSRWGSKAETMLLSDFDFLVQALFAEQSNIALQTHNAAHAGTLAKPELTRFQRLVAIWDKVLPHRTLQVSGDDIRATADGQIPYSAAQMSDGERAVFYMLGQVLVAEPASVLIFDEPELHVHRAILSRLWDEAEAARPDCAFLGRKPISASGRFQRRRFRDSSSERGAWRWAATNLAISNGRRSSRIFPTSRAVYPVSMIAGS